MNEITTMEFSRVVQFFGIFASLVCATIGVILFSQGIINDALISWGLSVITIILVAVLRKVTLTTFTLTGESKGGKD